MGQTGMQGRDEIINGFYSIIFRDVRSRIIPADKSFKYFFVSSYNRTNIGKNRTKGSRKKFLIA